MDSVLDGLGSTFKSIHLGIFLIGVASNFVLLAASFYSTPHKLKSYAIMIKFGTINDLICVCCDFFTMQRLLIVPGNLLYLSEGTCTRLSTRVCYLAYCLQLSTLQYSLYVMLTSFAYRLWILHHRCPRNRTIVLIMLAVSVLPLLNGYMFTFAQADIKVVHDFVRMYAPRYLQETGALSGHSGMTPQLSFTCLFMLVPIGPIYACLIVIRQRIMSKLEANLSVFSERTKRMHTTFVKMLTVQAALPLITIVALAIYLVLFFEVYYHPSLEKAISALAAIPSSLSAFCALYYIEPYRRFVTCSNSKCSASTTKSLK